MRIKFTTCNDVQTDPHRTQWIAYRAFSVLIGPSRIHAQQWSQVIRVATAHQAHGMTSQPAPATGRADAGLCRQDVRGGGGSCGLAFASGATSDIREKVAKALDLALPEPCMTPPRYRSCM